MPEPSAVRSGTDAGIIAVAPVGEVVAALLAAQRMVADFVGGQAGGRGALGRQLIERGSLVGIERLELACGSERSEARPGFDGQLVERQMTGSERERAIERRAPRGLGVAGQSVDQVEADAQ